jgi:hypothetical protein
MSPWYTSDFDYSRHEQEMERREQALARHRRQQRELLDEVDAEFPPCPICGEHAQPVFGVSSDPNVGYYEREQACVACIGREF